MSYELWVESCSLICHVRTHDSTLLIELQKKPMKTYQHSSNLSSTIVLPISGAKSWIFQLLMVATAVMLPAIAHISGAPIRWLLPMHWPVIFAALIYGWRGGVMIGSLAPASNYLLTGYPLLIQWSGVYSISNCCNDTRISGGIGTDCNPACLRRTIFGSSKLQMK